LNERIAMKRSLTLLFPFLFVLSMVAYAGEPQTFDEGKSAALSQGKPMLLEFLRAG